MILRKLCLLMLICLSLSAKAIESDAIFYSLPSQTQGQFLTAKQLFPHEKGGIWIQDKQNQIYYFDGQHFSKLPGRAFHQDIDLITYTSGLFWYTENGRLLNVDSEGKKDIVFEAPDNANFSAIGQSERVVWLYGHHHFYTFDTQTGKHTVHAVPMVTQGSKHGSTGIVDAVLVAGEWVVATQNSIFTLKPYGARRLLSKKFSGIKTLAFDRRNSRLLVGTNSGLFSVNMTTIKPSVESIVSGQVQTILMTESDYWIGTKEGLAVYQLNTKSLKHISASYQDDFALSNNYIMGLSEDAQGGVWIATEKGINYYSESSHLFKRVRFGREEFHLPYVHINDVDLIDDESAWLASNLGLYKVTVDFTNGRANEVRKVLEYDFSHVSQSAGMVWLSQGDKLIQYDQKSGQTYVVRSDNKWSGTPITQMVSDQEGLVWIATVNGLYRYSTQNKKTDVLGLEWMVDQYGSAKITSLFSSSEGTLWIGTDHGLYQYNGQEVVFFSATSQYGSVGSITGTIDGNVWTANSQGLARLNRTGLSKVSLPHLNSIPLCVASFNSGGWVTSTKGLHYYNQNLKLITDFTAPFGIVTNEFLPGGCSLSSTGSTLVLTSRLGLIFADVRSLLKSVQPTNDVLVGQIQIDHSLAMVAPQTEKEIFLDYGRSMSVLFGILPNFEIPQIQYRLLGTNKEKWVDFRGSQLTFENLEPGRYTLELKTMSQVGTSHEGARYVFVVKKPWYLLTKTLVLFTILLLIVLAALYIWRSKVTVKSNMRLRRLINLKTQQLRHQSQLLVSSNVQLRKQALTRKILVGDRVSKAKTALNQLKIILEDNRHYQSENVVLSYTDQALEPLNQILSLYANKKQESIVFDGQVVSFVLRAVVKGWQQEAEKAGVTLLLDDDTHGCLVKVKHFNLDMILNTLMASALIRSDSNQIIHLSARLSNERLRISVEDTGEGISEDEILSFEAQEYGIPVVEHKHTLSDTSLSAIAYMAEQSGGDFDFHYNQLTHVTQLSISWPIEACIPHSGAACDVLMDYPEDEHSDQVTHEQGLQHSPSKHRVNTNHQNTWLTKVYKLVDEHYANPDFTTSSAAKMLFVSERSLQRKFKALTGGSFMDYVTRVRLEQACELLMSGEKISDTAFETGFNDPSYFSQRFKHYFGLSPSKFIENSVE